MSDSPSLSTTTSETFDTAVAETAPLMRFDVMDRIARARSIARRYGPNVLHDVEALELHLARAGQEDAGPAADALITRFGGLAAVLAADRAELGRHIDEEAVFDLKLLRETAVRVTAAALPGRQLLTSSSAVQIYLKTLLAGLPREEFWVLFLDRKNQLLLSERLGQGTVDHAPVYPREVLRRALEVGASALILVHNHPSGDPSPSRQDLEMTKAIVEGGRALGVKVWDHMIVGGARVLSLKSEGLM